MAWINRNSRYLVWLLESLGQHLSFSNACSDQPCMCQGHGVMVTCSTFGWQTKTWERIAAHSRKSWVERCLIFPTSMGAYLWGWFVNKTTLAGRERIFFCGPHGVACSTSLLLLLRAQLPQSWTQFLGDNVKLCRVWTNVQVFETCFFQDVSASNQGHEDLDQAFSQQAALICRHVFDTPEQVTEIMDQNDLESRCAKIDEVAEWKEWVAVVGLHLKGLRAFFLISWKSFCLPLNFQMHVILYYHNLVLIAASSSSLRTGWVHSHLSTLWCC